MKWWRRVAGAAVGVMLGAVLGVGLAVPATAAGPLPLLVGACGGSMSTVTACPANVMMLKEAGILAMPSTGGGVVGTAAAPALTNTAGSAIGGATGLLAGIGATFGISQLFGSPSGTVQGAGVLQTDGVAGQTLTVTADLPGSVATKDYTGNVGSQSGDSTIYATVPYPGTSDMYYCVSSTAAYRSQNDGFTKNATGQLSSVIFVGSGPWSGCPPLPSGGRAGGFGQANHVGQANTDAVGWQAYPGAPYVLLKPAPVGAAPAVAGSIKRQLWCSDSAGNLVNFVDAQAASLQKGQTVNLHDMTCPAGKTAVDSSVDFVPTDTSKATVPIQPRSNWTPGTNPVLDAAIARPDCSTGSCLLVLSKTNGDPCGSIGQLCPDWAKDPNYQQNYKCTFGGQVVGIDSCSAYRDPSQGVQPNTKPDNTPYRVTDPVVKPGGQTVTDPAGTADPGTGVKPAPLPVDNPGANEDPNGCRSASWVDTLNPFNMFNTITCAMKDAFVPDPAKVQTAVRSVQDSWGRTPPAKVAGMVNSITGALPVGSGCSGISFTFPGVLGVAAQNFTVLNACSDPVAGVASIVRIVGAIGMILYGIFALTKMAGGVIALPGLGKTGGGE